MRRETHAASRNSLHYSRGKKVRNCPEGGKVHPEQAKSNYTNDERNAAKRDPENDRYTGSDTGAVAQAGESE